MKTIAHFLAVLFGFVALVSAAEVDESVVAQIAVKTDGTILFDGRKAEISELDRLLTPIIERRGVIWIRSVALRGQLHPKAIEVLKAIAAKRIPVRPFPKDVLEYVGADARLRKRT